MVNSKQKGARIERAFAKYLRDVWKYTARRGQQYSGGTDSPDIIVDEIDDLHFEVKGTKKFEPYKNFVQAKKDACGKVPIVIHKHNRGEWMVFMKAHDFFDIYTDNNGG